MDLPCFYKVFAELPLRIAGTAYRLRVALLLAAIIGCESRTKAVPPVVVGKVTVDGKPLSGGNVLFELHGVPVAEGRIDTDGTYVSTGLQNKNLKPGTFDIAVYRYEMMPDPNGAFVPTLTSPRRFANTNASGITFKVVLGKNRFDIRLKSDAE